MDYLARPSAAGDAAPAAAAHPVAPAPPDAALPADPRLAGWKREGEFLYRRRQRLEGWGTEVWPDPFSPEASSPDQLVFYDTETTGLSGGAGTVVFLFGAAWCEGRDLAVEQLFLSDFPGEPEFLHAVRGLLAPYRAFISYNGATFDSHLLKTRFAMNGIPWEPGPQVDLLHHSRRLWKTVTGDCSLHAMETRVLGFTRESDVPGAEIPGIWLEFLRTGRPGRLPVVFDHNAMDVASLARLHRLIGRLLGGDRSAARVDEQALGRWMISRTPSAGAALLADAFGRGDLGAGAALSLHHKRRGEWDRAVALWESMLGSRSVFAAVELAKYHEHRSRLPARALELVREALSWGLPLDQKTRRELRRRGERLERRLAGRGGGPRGDAPTPSASPA
jgi:uncharacterized protein